MLLSVTPFFLTIFTKTFIMKFRVLKFMTRRSEGMKPYKVGSDINLTKAEADPLLKYGFIEKVTKKAK